MNFVDGPLIKLTNDAYMGTLYDHHHLNNGDGQNMLPFPKMGHCQKAWRYGDN